MVHLIISSQKLSYAAAVAAGRANSALCQGGDGHTDSPMTP